MGQHEAPDGVTERVLGDHQYAVMGAWLVKYFRWAGVCIAEAVYI